MSHYENTPIREHKHLFDYREMKEPFSLWHILELANSCGVDLKRTRVFISRSTDYVGCVDYGVEVILREEITAK